MKLKFVVKPEVDKSYASSDDKRKEMDKLYGLLLDEIKLKCKAYQDSWDEINNSFSDYIEKITGYKWAYSQYECVLSVMFGGISNWGTSNQILRSWNEEPNSSRRITAHELILSHYFDIYRKNYSSEGLTDGQVWALAEIASFALTSLTSEAKKFWPENSEYYLNHNYPQIVGLQNKLREVFIEEKDFDEYIKEGIKLVKDYPNMSPKGN